MKLKHAAFLASVLLLAACGGGKQEGDVRFIGLAPVNAKDKDVREVRTHCPGCGDPIAVDTAKCPKKSCKTEIHWSNDYRCPSCRGSGRCTACSLMEQNKGACYNCKDGYLVYQGQSPECPNCKGTAKCPVCKGSTNCDFCGGTGKVGKEIVKAKSAKFAAGGKEDNELPPSDARPPVDVPKDAPKDAPKEEPKKDAAPAPVEGDKK
jgi:hypothetical protein